MKKKFISKSMPQYGRTQALFNTGTRVHKPIKGKGSYKRKGKNKNNYEGDF